MQNTFEIGIFIFFSAKKCISVAFFKNRLFFQKKFKFEKNCNIFFEFLKKNFENFFFQNFKKKNILK